ncbi:uncharacterized protein METZ01_LOCUS338949, partial [marine metagenome]
TLIEDSKTWSKIIDRKKLGMNKIHIFKKEDLLNEQEFTHIRIDIFPDGGIARLKLLGDFI